MRNIFYTRPIIVVIPAKILNLCLEAGKIGSISPVIGFF